MKEQMIEKFMKECGVDMKDFETAGVFPYYNSKKQKWTSISRGAAWRMYAEWLENKFADHLTEEQGDKGAMTKAVIDEAMRVTAKDVIGPKVVRDGFVKPQPELTVREKLDEDYLNDEYEQAEKRKGVEYAEGYIEGLADGYHMNSLKS